MRIIGGCHVLHVAGSGTELNGCSEGRVFYLKIDIFELLKSGNLRIYRVFLLFDYDRHELDAGID